MAGETTVDLIPTTPLPTSKTVAELLAPSYTVALRTTDLALNDVTGVCKIPNTATIKGFIFQTDDLDANAGEALVWSILVDTTVFASGITNAVAKAGTLVVGVPITVTTDTIIYLKATTAAATAAAGNITITPLYTTSA